MAKKLMAWLALAFLTPLLTQCASTRSAPPTPTAVPTISIPTPTPKSAKIEDDARTLAAESVKLLNQADRYQFTVSAVYRTNFEGKPREWTFSGTGAVAKPGKFQWTVQGPADSFSKVVILGGQSYCADARGESKECSLAFGGPRPGASPYTIISYLQNFDRVGELATKSVQGKDYHYLTFSPSLPKVASLDSAHSKALASVASVGGEAWIDKGSRLPIQEKVLIRFQPQAAGEETVEATISFQKYNQPVDIKMPR